MSSLCRISIFSILTLVFLVHKPRCEENVQFQFSSKSATVNPIEQRPSPNMSHSKYYTPDYLKIVESTHQPMSSRDARGHRYLMQDRHNTIDTLQSSTISVFDNTLTSSPCTIQYCSEDTTVSCTGLALTEVRSVWFPKNTTMILLDYNDLKYINNISFSHLTDLRYLSVSNNKLEHIDPVSFRGLSNLKTLNLEYNRLKENGYPPGVFDSLESLRDLRLRYNKLRDNLPTRLFKNLNNLSSLTLDVTGDTLVLGNQFPKLSTLSLVGDVINIDSDSFNHVKETTNLIVTDFHSLSNFSDTALHSLYNLDSLTVVRVYIGISKSLLILKHLVGRNMTTIYFNKVSFRGTTNVYNNEGVLSLQKTKYLIQICVQSFSMIGSNIFIIKRNAFVSSLWDRCLKSFDVSGNPLQGTTACMISIWRLKNIEIINLEDRKRSCFIKESFPKEDINARESEGFTIATKSPVYQIESWATNSSNNNFGIGAFDGHNRKLFNGNRFSRIHEVLKETVINTERNLNIGGGNFLKCIKHTIHRDDGQFFGYTRLYFSKSLKYLKFGRLNVKVLFVGTDSLIYIDFRDSRFWDFRGHIIGLDALKVLKFSGNDMSLLSESFFDGMCNIEEMDLSTCQLNTDFMFNHSDRVFYNLHLLKRLDISSNSLCALKPGTFASNRNLEKLDFSKNRFKNIPFDLKHTPKLKYLDLRENSVASLESHERFELDKLARNPEGFNLQISGNVLSCGCDNLPFLYWLSNTRVRLDDVRNYTCMDNEGHFSYWRISDDIEMLWRKCWGRFFLYFAVIGLISMITVFLSIFFIWKNKTFIQSIILRMLTGYKLNRPEDYQIGVFIGYSDKDYSFSCNVLRKFIEEKLKFRTYVYHRDMDGSGFMARHIMEAINASWRIILVISENFLLSNDEWSMFTYRTAIYALSPANPARVVVIVHKDLQHQLPPEVLSAIPEENILVVPEWKLSYSLCEKLKTCL